MGKTPNGLGKFSGKVGGVVFAISNGEQIVRAYQPIVNNPKSAGQMAQRSKGNLVGQISSFVPKAALFGLGANARRRRAEFLRILLKAANVTTSNGNYTATIPDEDVIFSKGSVVNLFTATGVVANENYISVSVTGSALADPGLYAAFQCRLVAMVYDKTTQELVEVATIMANKPEQGQSASTTILLAHPEGYDVVVYGIPMSTNDGSKVSITTDMATKDDDTIAALLSANRNSIVFDYGYSRIFGQANFTPTQAKEEVISDRKKK